MENITQLNVEQMLSFSWFDYTLFFLMLLLSVLIGIYFGCFGSKQNTTSEYLLGSRNMKVFPVAVSLIAGHLSGITLLGIPAEIYMYGGQYYACLITTILVSIVVVYIYLPTFYNLEVKSSYEYLKIRFDNKIRTIALILFVISSLLYIPIVIFVPALAFNQVTGISIHKVTPVICSICIFYTTIGGLKAVVWTDTLQFVVTSAALFSVFVLGVQEAGGLANVTKIAQEGDRLDFFNLDPDPTIRTTFWGVVIGMTFAWVTLLGIAPSCVQRFMSVPTLRKSKLTVIYFGIGIFITKSLVCFCGYIMYAKYKDCDPFSNKQIKHPDQILPYYVLDVAKDIPGLPGLFISGVFSTALSTMSAHLNTLAGVLYEDFFSKFLPQKTTDEVANRIIKITVVVAGTICVALVFVVEKLGGVIQISGCLSGITTGPLLGLFTLGMLFPQVGAKATLYASIVTLTIMSWIVGGFQYHYIKKNIQYSYKPLSVEGCNAINETLANSTASFFSTESTTILNGPNLEEQPLYLFRLSFYWYPVVGFVLIILITLFLTYVLKEENEPSKRYNKNLYSPLIQRFIQDKSINYESVENALNLVEGNLNK